MLCVYDLLDEVEPLFHLQTGPCCALSWKLFNYFFQRLQYFYHSPGVQFAILQKGLAGSGGDIFAAEIASNIKKGWEEI